MSPTPSGTAPARSAGTAGMTIVSKAGAFLTALERRGEASLTEVAEATGEPVSSVYRLLATLEAVGWVEAGTRRGRYRPGVAWIRLAHAFQSRTDLRALVLPHLHHLFDETGQTVFLCVPRGRRAVCIERIEGARVRSLVLELGGSLPLHRGGAPLAILAAEDDDTVADYTRALRAGEIDGARPEDADELPAELAETRDRGYAISDGDVTPGIAAVGAPLLDHRGRVVGAISVSGPRGDVLGPGSDVAGLVRAAADEVGTRLGHRGGPVPVRPVGAAR